MMDSPEFVWLSGCSFENLGFANRLVFSEIVRGLASQFEASDSLAFLLSL